MRALAFGAPRLCLVVLAALLLQCSSPLARIEVQVTGLPPDAVSLDVTLLRTGAGEAEQKALASGLSRFVLLVTQPAPEGARIGLRALGSDQCLLARGQYELPDPLSGEYSISVDLQPLAEPSCLLSVDFVGAGGGTVELRAGDPQQGRQELQPFTKPFSLRYPRGTRIELRQYPELTSKDDSLFVGWAGACRGTGPCSLQIADEPLRVEAAFAPRRLCTQNPGHDSCWENPLPQGNQLSGVWAGSANEAWAVGGYGTVRRWNGAFWLTLPAPSTAYLSSVWGDGTGQVWISGDGGLVHRWSGGRWSPEATGTPNGLSSLRGRLRSSGRPELWAVGAFGTVLRREDAGWRALPTGGTEYLSGLFVHSEQEVWIVGEAGVALHWNGSSLQRSSTGVTVKLWDVWGSGPSDVWAVGGGGTLLHWDGASWRKVALGNERSDLTSIWGSGPRDVWIGTKGGVLWHFDGDAWRLVSAGISAKLPPLYGIHGSDSDSVWFVGTSGNIYRWNGVYLGVSSGTFFQDDLNNIWKDDQGKLVASGNRGALYQRSEDQWFQFAQPTNRDFFKIIPDRSNPRVLLGATVDGEIGFAVSGDWQFFETGTTQALVDVFVDSADDIWAVGLNGTIVRYSSAGFSVVPSGVTVGLLGVWGSSKDDIWFVGGGGVILHWDGRALTRWPSPTTNGLRAVWGRSATEVWAVGGSGTVLRWDGARWTDISPADPEQRALLFTSVWASGPADVWVSAFARWLHHFDGVRWQRIETGYDGSLSQVYGTSRDDVWVVGAGGAILKRSTPVR